MGTFACGAVTIISWIILGVILLNPRGIRADFIDPQANQVTGILFYVFIATVWTWFLVLKIRRKV
jgi:hypothetical protein